MPKPGQRYVARYHEGPADGTTDVWIATEDGPKQHVGVQVGLKTAWYVYTGFSAGVASEMKHLYQYEFTE